MPRQASFDITPEKEASKLQFLRRQFFGAPPAVSRRDVDLKGKIAIVTGASGGIGLEYSRQLLSLGLSRLILAVRNETKGEIARKALTNATDLEPSQSIEVWKLDYASYESIMAFVQRVEGLSPRVDVAILNAGINRSSFNLNPKTGHEEDLQTNYLSTMLLVLLLLRVFERATHTTNPSQLSPGRIVVVSSDTAAWAKFHEKTKEPLLPAFDDKGAKWDGFNRYATTKLLGQLFITELARRVPPALAVVNCANPGLCYGSDLGRELGLGAAVFIRVFGRSSSVGARTLVHAATQLDDSYHGQYVEDCKLRPYVLSLLSQVLMTPFIASHRSVRDINSR
ncbi:uncharacterized protein JN550_003164 [Neoarthrinium moseri]|uniref:uncharacterized protein n=1 Tax=Neoarthrinium moseri TaxID=1658444 RepID=UPI001FDD4CB5|nr:uncharacterized protein JN550_003164 [Neoarthrinium moseri]KAI1873895.1 hypothetical protein JN550_003164 [Neoarthrinium moseri]